MMMSEYENDYAFYRIKDNILFVEYRDNALLSLSVAQKVVTDRIQFQQEKIYPVYCDIRKVTEIDIAGRTYLAKEGSVLISAIAFIVNNPFSVSTTIIDLYLKKQGSPIPYKIFSDREKALDYLRKYT